jgi:deoxycytidylate deaminase
MKLTKSHRSYFKTAKAMSEMADYKKYQIGCVATYKHKIISSGYNTTVTNPLQKRYNQLRFSGDSTAHSKHAEVDCLLPLLNRKDIDFGRVSLYLYREHKSGEPACARPCQSCQALIKELGIRNIYYSNDGGYSHEEFI